MSSTCTSHSKNVAIQILAFGIRYPFYLQVSLGGDVNILLSRHEIILLVTLGLIVHGFLYLV